MTQTALILIDIQQGFLSPEWGQRNNPELEGNIAALLHEWRTRQWPIFHVRHDSLLKGSPLSPGQKGNDFMECSKPFAGEPIISKTVNSALIGTHLESQLRNLDLKNLLVAGLTTDHCVSTTVRMAGNLGFNVRVIADAVATFPRKDLDGSLISAAEIHRAAIASINHEFAQVSECTKTFLEDLGCC